MTTDHAAKWQGRGLRKALAIVSVACGSMAQGLGPETLWQRPAQTASLMCGNGSICTCTVGEGQDCRPGLENPNYDRIAYDRNGTYVLANLEVFTANPLKWKARKMREPPFHFILTILE